MNMAKNTATYILVAVLLIPAITLAVLVYVGTLLRNWYDVILPVLLVYLVSFVASVIVRKACDKKVGNWRKALGWLLLKTVLFTFGIVGVICYIVSGGAVLVAVHPPDIDINMAYLAVLVVAWVVMACVNEVMIK
jgi:membrane protease YdiL (CAAX protease family)